MLRLSKFLFCFAISISVAPAAAAEKKACIKSASAISWDGLCTDRNYTYTDQCTVTQEDGPETCMVESNACGCQVDVGTNLAGIGSAEKGCGNACIDFSTDIPTGEDVTCTDTGANSVSFEGTCAAGLHATHYTPQCQFEEKSGSCTVTEKSCGCLFWTEDENKKMTSQDIGALSALCGAVNPCDYDTIIDEASSSSSSNSSSNVRMFVVATLVSSLVVSL